MFMKRNNSYLFFYPVGFFKLSSIERQPLRLTWYSEREYFFTNILINKFFGVVFVNFRGILRLFYSAIVNFKRVHLLNYY